MLRERLIAGGPRCFQFAVYVGEPRAASGSGRQRPRAPERLALVLELPGERPCQVDLAESG